VLLTLKITCKPTGDTCEDTAMARRWLAEQIEFFTGLPVSGFAGLIHPHASFEVTELEYLDTPTGLTT
jgi:hypothetical protein